MVDSRMFEIAAQHKATVTTSQQVQFQELASTTELWISNATLHWCQSLGSHALV
jgi:hypothetical protein